MNIYRGIRLWPFIRDNSEVVMNESKFRDFLMTQGVELPEEYLNFLRVTNGGRIDFKQRVMLKIEPRNRDFQLSQFYPSDPNMKWEALESLREEHLEYYPSYLFIIGSFLDDTKLAIIASGDDSGSCVVIDPAKTGLSIGTEPTKLLSTKGVFVAAASFDDLLDRIEVNES